MNFAKRPSVSDNALIPAGVVRASSQSTPPAHVAVTTYRPAFLYKPQYSTTPSTSTASPPLIRYSTTAYPQPNINNVYIKHHGDPLFSASPIDPLNDNYLQPSYDVASRYIPPRDLNNALVSSSSERYHIPSNVFEPPARLDLKQHGIKPISIVSSTPSPISITSKNLASVSPLNHESYSTTPRPTPYYASTTVSPSVGSSSSNYVSPIEQPYTAKPGSYYAGKGYARYPADYYGAKGYRPYDGESVTNEDGFKYYLPRQYHEEQGSGGSDRDGSFGYIDPFGIRRVVYYNVRPGSGFRHRKNNRFVGFNATPYDPRPARKK